MRSVSGCTWQAYGLCKAKAQIGDAVCACCTSTIRSTSVFMHEWIRPPAAWMTCIAASGQCICYTLAQPLRSPLAAYACACACSLLEHWAPEPWPTRRTHQEWKYAFGLVQPLSIMAGAHCTQYASSRQCKTRSGDLGTGRLSIQGHLCHLPRAAKRNERGSQTTLKSRRCPQLCQR